MNFFNQIKLIKQVLINKPSQCVVVMGSLLALNACVVTQQKNQPTVMIKTEVEYLVDGTVFKGYMVHPQGKKNLPGVLVVHEWWGHNAYARLRADRLAELGYAAFALDMYGDGKVADHPKKANEFMTQTLNQQGAVNHRFVAALKILKDSPVTDDHKMAAIGYCFGGAIVLSMARAGVDLDGVVSFHGSLQNLAPIAADVTAKFLVLNGADDPFVTLEQKQAFKSGMDAAKLSYEFMDYPGVLHAFTDPEATAKGEKFSLPLKYDAAADQASWNKMQLFLKSVF